MATRQQLEQQLVAAHRTGNVQAAQQAAYAIRQYDQSALSAQVPSINAPLPIERVPKPTFGSWLENVGIGIGEGLGEQVQGIGELAQRGASALGAYAKDPLKASAAAFMGALAPAMRGFTQPVQTARDVGAGLVETGKQMYQQATSGPVGLGTVIGQNLDLPGPGGQRRPTMAELDVYHGTPHTFEPEEGAPLGRFRSSKIGTGEGAQAYGYGLYFSEAPSVAKSYQNTVSAIHKSGVPTIQGKPINWDDPRETAAFELSRHNGDRAAAADFHARMFLGGEDNPAVKLLRSNEPLPTVDMPGRLYQVDLPDAKIEQMLDWDKPLSEQPASVQKALNSFIDENRAKNAASAAKLRETAEKPEYRFVAVGLRQRADELEKEIAGLNGRELYNRIKTLEGGEANASERLRSLGIPGIKYLDAGSRAGEKGTRNFVVFPGEEQHLTILERDGVKAEVPKPAAPKPTTWQGMSRDEFLGSPKITTNRNAVDLKPRALTTVVTEQPKPFKGNLTIRMNEDGAAVYDGDKVIASYNFGDTLVVDKKYRKQGIGEELVYQWRKANPTAPPATERTKASQAIQEKVWQRLLNEQG